MPDDREQIIDPHTAYQMTSMLEGVIQRGTATSLKALERPLAGKTGTTNEEKDAWFVGYTPDLVVGVFMGYDTPVPMGKGNTGGKVAAPDLRQLHEGGAGRQARRAVPHPAGHQAGARQPAHRPARRRGRSAEHHGSVQAGRRAGRRLLGDRLHGSGTGAAAGPRRRELGRTTAYYQPPAAPEPRRMARAAAALW